MRPFAFAHAVDLPDALRLAAGGPPTAPSPSHERDPVQYLAGGTALLDLMKLGSWQPELLVDINALAGDHAAIHVDADGLHLGALARMSDVADHPAVARDHPVLAQALQQAASPQLRNMASLAGNVLQRTRCNYFRDPSWPRCNKRVPGTGCGALDGSSRHLAVLGVSEHCIAHYPGDFANALACLDAVVRLRGPDGARSLPVDALHRLPGDTPEAETVLLPREIVTGFTVPARSWHRRSLYVKVRDRQSYAFALASAAVALDLDGGVVRAARIALGGVAVKPWRARDAEASLVGRPLDEATAAQAATIAFRDAVTRPDNAFKPELGRRTLVRALLAVAALEI